MKNGYVRRADSSDMSFEFQLGLTEWELENVCETPDEIENAQKSIARLKQVIASRVPRPAPPGGLAMNPTHDEYLR